MHPPVPDGDEQEDCGDRAWPCCRARGISPALGHAKGCYARAPFPRAPFPHAERAIHPKGCMGHAPERVFWAIHPKRVYGPVWADAACRVSLQLSATSHCTQCCNTFIVIHMTPSQHSRPSLQSVPRRRTLQCTHSRSRERALCTCTFRERAHGPIWRPVHCRRVSRRKTQCAQS
jgi:hypothetical protein